MATRALIRVRIAVISDIHGNCFALDVALADIRKMSIDKIVCLGDTIQGGPQPTETVARLREMACPTVMGNADALLLKGEADVAEPVTKEQLEVRAWTLSKLSTGDMTFIRGYQPTVEILLDDTQRLMCFHGSPTSFDDVLLPDTPDEKWDRLLGPYAPAVMAGGHTYTQQMRRVGNGRFFNPGSVGVAYNHNLPEEKFHLDPWAEYAILTYGEGHESVEFRQAHYDVGKLIEIIRTSGRPHADKMIGDYMRSP